jgi:hypothetical protein
MLRCNTAKGTATVISEEVSHGGKHVVRVLMDSNGEERIFLREFTTESSTPVPPVAKAKPARKPRKKKTEDIPDELLVPETTFSPLPPLDTLPDESADRDEVVSEHDPGDCTETV